MSKDDGEMRQREAYRKGAEELGGVSTVEGYLVGDIEKWEEIQEIPCFENFVDLSACELALHLHAAQHLGFYLFPSAFPLATHELGRAANIAATKAGRYNIGKSRGVEESLLGLQSYSQYSRCSPQVLRRKREMRTVASRQSLFL